MRTVSDKATCSQGGANRVVVTRVAGGRRPSPLPPLPVEHACAAAAHQQLDALLLALRHQHRAHDALVAALLYVRQLLHRIAQYEVALLVQALEVAQQHAAPRQGDLRRHGVGGRGGGCGGFART